MSRFPLPRGTARAIRRGNVAPSIGFVPVQQDEAEDLTSPSLDDDPYWQRMLATAAECEDRQRYRDLRDEGYTHTQALLMSGLSDPDSLSCT